MGVVPISARSVQRHPVLDCAKHEGQQETVSRHSQNQPLLREGYVLRGMTLYISKRTSDFCDSKISPSHRPMPAGDFTVSSVQSQTCFEIEIDVAPSATGNQIAAKQDIVRHEQDTSETQLDVEMSIRTPGNPREGNWMEKYRFELLRQDFEDFALYSEGETEDSLSSQENWVDSGDEADDEAEMGAEDFADLARGIRQKRRPTPHSPQPVVGVPPPAPTPPPAPRPGRLPSPDFDDVPPNFFVSLGC